MGKIALVLCAVAIFGVILGSDAERGGGHDGERGGGHHGGNRRPPPGFGLGFGSGIGCRRARYILVACNNSTTTGTTTTQRPGGRPQGQLICSDCFDNAVQICTRKPPPPPATNATTAAPPP